MIMLRARLMASFTGTSFGQLADQHGARAIVEEAGDGGAAETLLDPRDALGGDPHVLEGVSVGSHRGGEAVLDEAAGDLLLLLAVVAGDGAEIDDEGAVGAQPLDE